MHLRHMPINLTTTPALLQAKPTKIPPARPAPHIIARALRLLNRHLASRTIFTTTLALPLLQLPAVLVRKLLLLEFAAREAVAVLAGGGDDVAGRADGGAALGAGEGAGGAGGAVKLGAVRGRAVADAGLGDGGGEGGFDEFGVGRRRQHGAQVLERDFGRAGVRVPTAADWELGGGGALCAQALGAVEVAAGEGEGGGHLAGADGAFLEVGGVGVTDEGAAAFFEDAGREVEVHFWTFGVLWYELGMGDDRDVHLDGWVSRGGVLDSSNERLGEGGILHFDVCDDGRKRVLAGLEADVLQRHQGTYLVHLGLNALGGSPEREISNSHCRVIGRQLESQYLGARPDLDNSAFDIMEFGRDAGLWGHEDRGPIIDMLIWANSSLFAKTESQKSAGDLLELSRI